MTEETETQGITGAIALCLLAAILVLAGCGTDEGAKVKDGKASAPVTPHEAAAVAVGNCATAVSTIATSPTGDAITKAYALAAVERMCGQAHMVQQAPQQSLGATLWQAGLQMADLVLRGYGIKAQRDVGINQANQAAAMSIASYGAFQNIAASGFASNATIAGNIQTPPANVTNSYTLSGTGVLGSGTYTAPITTSTNPSPRVCTATPTGLACVGG